MKQMTQDDASREIRRIGFWVIVSILLWSAGWFTVHELIKAHHHAVTAHARG